MHVVCAVVLLILEDVCVCGCLRVLERTPVVVIFINVKHNRRIVTVEIVDFLNKNCQLCSLYFFKDVLVDYF